MIDTNKKIRFSPDRGLYKYDYAYLKKIIFENDDFVLCETNWELENIEENVFLFSKKNGKVLTINGAYHECYRAENYETE